MSHFGMSKRMYADRRAPDGLLAVGWRRVKKGGRVKFAGAYYAHPKLADIVGELVNVQMADYWCQDVYIFRGAIGCTGFFCEAHPAK